MDFSKVKLLIYDCDGVLTDNRVLVDETGKESAFFHRGDGYGVRLIRELGIPQIIVSTEVNPIVKYRAEKLKIEVFHSGEDKASAVKRCGDEHGIEPSFAMFIGNDLNDYKAMMAVGFRGCPSDAEPEIQAISHWISSKAGGFGVIRELCRCLYESR